MNRARIKLILLLTVFIGPLVAAFIGYYGLDGAKLQRTTTNHAPLLSPPVAIAPFTNPTVTGERISLPSLKQRWSLIHIVPAQCAAQCEKFLYHTRQTRLALGRNANRVQRIFIAPNRALLNRLKDQHPDAVLMLSGDDGLEVQLTEIIKRNHNAHDTVLNAVLVDPLGNAMMRIPSQLAPKLLLKDLKHLLKVSRIG